MNSGSTYIMVISCEGLLASLRVAWHFDIEAFLAAMIGHVINDNGNAEWSKAKIFRRWNS